MRCVRCEDVVVVSDLDKDAKQNKIGTTAEYYVEVVV